MWDFDVFLAESAHLTQGKQRALHISSSQALPVIVMGRVQQQQQQSLTALHWLLRLI